MPTRPVARTKNPTQWVMPLLLAGAGLLVTGFIVQGLRADAQADQQRRFERLAEKLNDEVRQRLQTPLHGLRGLRATFASVPQVDSDTFRRWVQARRISSDLPGVSQFGYAERVPAAKLAAFVRAQRDAGAATFMSPQAADSRTPLQVVRVLEPASTVWPGPGDDLGGRAIVAAAIDEALLRDDVTLGGRITLGAGRGDGLLFLVPLFARPPTSDALSERMSALAGILFATVDVRALLNTLSSDTEVSFDLFEGDPSAGASVLHVGGNSDKSSRLHTLTIEVGGRPLTLRVSSRPGFEDAAGSASWVAVASAGTALSLLAAFCAWLLLAGRRRAERLAASMTGDLERLATVVRRTSNAVIMTDAALVIVWVNEGFTRLYGYTAEEVVGRSPGELLGSGQTAPAVNDNIVRGAREGTAVSEDVVNRARDGSLRWVHIDVQPMRGPDGQLQGFVEIGTDLTATHAAAEDLAAERERLAGIIAGTNVGTWEWDLSNGGFKLDDRSAAILGRGLSELSPVTMDTWAEICHPADRQRTRDRMTAHLRGEVDIYECDSRMRHKDGGWTWVQARGRISKRGANGKPLWVAGTHMDISQRMRADEALRDSQAVLDRAGRIAGVGGWQFDTRDGSVRWTAQVFHILDLAVDSVLELQDAFAYCAVAQRPQLEQAFLATLDNGQGWDMELPYLTANGRSIWVRSLGEGELEDGVVVRIFGTLQDITSRKQLEMRLAEEERFVRAVTDHLPVRVAYFDAEGRYRFVNQAICDRFALPREQIIGRTLAEAMGEDPDPTLLAHIERVRAGETVHWEGAEMVRDKLRMSAVTLIPAKDEQGQVRGAYATTVDVTDLRHSEQELRRAYEVMQSIVENMPCAISVFDSDLTLVLHNSQFRTLLHFPDSLFEGPRTHFESIIRFNAERGEYGNVDIDTVVSSTVERSRHPTHHQFERTRPDGSVLEVRGAPMPGGGFVTTYVDITARKRLEAEQQRVAAMLRAVMEALPCGLTVHDADNAIVLHNDKWAQVYALEPAFLADAPLNVDKVVGLMWQRGEYGPLTHAEALAAAQDRARQASQAPHFWLRQRPGGIFLEVRSAPAPGGGFVSTYTDVSEQRRVEAERENARALLSGAIEAVDEAFVLFDPDDRLVLCNDKYRALYAASADLIVPGARFEDIIRGGAERGQYAAAVGRVDAWVAERMVTHLSGDQMLVQQLDDGTWLRTIERRMADGHIVGFRIDVTDLMQARQAAEQASQMKSQFLANMSHEIRTPMNAILGMLSLLQRTEQTPRQLEYTRKTEGAAKSLLALLNDILDFSKVEAGKMVLDPQPFRIDQMLRDLSVIVSANAGTKPVELMFDADATLPRSLLGDELRLRQVLINLCGNALKFTERGEVTLSVRVLALSEADATIEFAVTDTGIGIAPENQARIFTGFTQAESSTTRRFGGTGLGLAISQRLVALMGGELALHSELGRGSRFSFCLAMSVPEHVEPPARQSLQRLRTLIVDDNPRSLALLQAMTTALGWQVATATHGEQALELAVEAHAAGAPYQAIFIDWSMPGMDGGQTARRLRQLADAQEPALILMGSAQARELLSRREGEDQRLADGFLAKPVTASMMHDAVIDAFASQQPAALAQRTATATTTMTRPLAGLRLLVVEDNPNNQQVARELLEDEGAHITIAHNGQEGVDAVAAAQPAFDAVLMDIQMPVMDGYAATRHIRQTLGRTALPIIAMTANAMASDRAECLAVGMNEHVGKPFDLARLISVLLRLTGRGTAPALALAPAAPTAGVSKALSALTTLATRHGIDLRAALERYMGKLAVYTRMLQNFERSLHQLPAELAAAVAQGDLGTASRAAHTLRGLAATLGVDRLAAAAGEAETLLLGANAAQHAAACAQAVAAAAVAAAPGIAELTSGLAALAGPAPAAAVTRAFDAAACRERIAQVADLVNSCDMGALELMTGLREQFSAGANGPLRTALAALDSAVSALDFELAARLCQGTLDTLADTAQA